MVGFVAKHRGIWGSLGSAKRSVFGAAAFVPVSFVPSVLATAAMEPSMPGFERASFPAMGAMPRAGSGTII